MSERVSLDTIQTGLPNGDVIEVAIYYNKNMKAFVLTMQPGIVSHDFGSKQFECDPMKVQRRVIESNISRFSQKRLDELAQEAKNLPVYAEMLSSVLADLQSENDED